MAVKKAKAEAKPRQCKTAAMAKLDSAFAAALAELERLARERIDKAKDPMKVGRETAVQIRALADKVEDEIIEQGLTLTEAYDSHDLIGVGLGVL